MNDFTPFYETPMDQGSLTTDAEPAEGRSDADNALAAAILGPRNAGKRCSRRSGEHDA
jgi:hypothetical protein